MKALNVRFSGEEHEALTKLKEAKEISINALIRQAVREFLAKQDTPIIR